MDLCERHGRLRCGECAYIEQLEEENKALKKMLSATMDDMQKIRESIHQAEGRMESAIHNYFERVKQIEGQN